MPDRTGSEWLVEEGIGEDRAVRLRGETITDAILEWHSDLRPGSVADAKLIARRAGAPRGTARFSNGEEALVDGLPAHAAEGAPIRLEITRAALFENRRGKRAQARPTEKIPRSDPSLAARLQESGASVRVVRRFPPCDWNELVGEAGDRRVAFAGGTLHFSPTPAMTLVDVDGEGPPEQLALAAVTPLAAALRRFALGGSIGIDFPTLAEKAGRRRVDEALAAALADWPHERTAMNGFGFIQIVARLRRPSLLHLLAFRPNTAAVHRLLREAEQLEGPGAVELRLSQHLIDLHLKPEWVAELGRRTGREVRITADVDGGMPHAQLVTR